MAQTPIADQCTLSATDATEVGAHGLPVSFRTEQGGPVGGVSSVSKGNDKARDDFWSRAEQLTPITLIAKDFCYGIRKSGGLVPSSLRSNCCTRNSGISSNSSCCGPMQDAMLNLENGKAAAAPLQCEEAEAGGSSGLPLKGKQEMNLILQNINLCVKPGSMLVIMGPSGSGKTTLLNALAGRSKPSSRVSMGGSLIYRGAPPGTPLSSFSTYVMQKDLLPSYLTVWEYLNYFARLKLPGVSKAARHVRIKEVLQSINLYRCRDTRIGGSAHKSLSGGEMKRVALAVELLSNPSLIFLDEPTTGLDAALAFETMRLLLRLARMGGRTIVCTVHQPRSQLFAMFDQLLLLHGGRTVFQGPASQCNSYFENLGLRCPPLFNPADFLLDLLTVRTELEETTVTAGGAAGMETADAGGAQQASSEEGEEPPAAHILMETDSAEARGNPLTHFESHMVRVAVDQAEVNKLPGIFEKSSLHADVLTDIERELAKPVDKQLSRGLQQRLLEQKDAINHWCTEFSVITRMTAISLLRNPLASLVQICLNALLGVMVGAIFWNSSSKPPLDLAARNLLGCIFFLTTHVVFSPMDCLSLFSDDRELFNRDTANGTYTPSAYFFARSIASFPFQHFPLTLVLIFTYWMAGMAADAVRFIIYLVIGQLTIFTSVSFLLLAASLSPRLSVAQSFVPTVLVVLMLVCGYFIRDQDIPGWIRWLRYISFVYYPYLCFAANEFIDNPVWADLPDDVLETTGGLSDARLGYNVFLLIVVGVVLRALAFFALKYTNRRIGVEA